MKYILKKEYPGSPKLGFILDKMWEANYQLNCYLINGLTFNPNNHTEFWEQVVEKDYEILSLISTNIDKTIITYKDGGGVYRPNFFEKVYKSIDHWVQCFTMNSNPWQIHSVKRLSDFEIFTIGDNTNSGVITQIQWDNSKGLWLDFKNHGGYSDYKSLKHAKQPLFTTEDGVEVCEGDYYHSVNPLYIYCGKNIITLYNRPDKSNHWETNRSCLKFFSTKEKSEEYIFMNKPVLSLNDIQNNSNITIGGMKSLTELVKQKLK